MIELTFWNGLFCAVIVAIILFVLIAPTGTLARVSNNIGNFFQRLFSWFKK